MNGTVTWTSMDFKALSYLCLARIRIQGPYCPLITPGSGAAPTCMPSLVEFCREPCKVDDMALGSRSGSQTQS